MTFARLLRSLHVGFLLLAVACAGCAATPKPEEREIPARVLDALIGSSRVRLSFEALVSRAVLAPDSDIRVTALGRDEHHSHHVVAIRKAEEPHRHDDHDLLVVMLKGYGEILIGQETKPVGPGSIVFIPRRTVHAFANKSLEPAVAYAIYSPPFDGKDRVAAE